MRTLPLLLGLTGCIYNPPDDLPPGTPGEAPILVVEEGEPGFVCAPEREANVACVIDGDTLDLQRCGGEDVGGERVRLLGIDAPETEKPDAEAECYADVARTEMVRILTGRTVTLRFDRECTGVFGRTLAYVYIDLEDALAVLPNTALEDMERYGFIDDLEAGGRPLVLVQHYMLMQGFATRFDEEWVEELYLENDLIDAERFAQSRREGLWGVCN